MEMHFDRAAVSAAAKRLRGHLARQDCHLKHQAALDAVARVLGHEDANTLYATLKTAPERTDGTVPDPERFLAALSPVLQAARAAQDAELREIRDPAGLACALADIEAVAARLRAGPDKPVPPHHHPLMAAAIRQAGGPAPALALSFDRDPHGRPRVVPDACPVHHQPIERALQQARPEDILGLREALRTLAETPDAPLPEGLIAVAQESPDRFRLATTLPPGRDAARAIRELNTRLAPQGRAIVEAAGTYQLQRDDDLSSFRDDREAAANLVKRAAMGDPIARRIFGFLQRFAWAEFQDLMRDLRQHAASRTDVDRNPARCGSAVAADDALHQLWSWVDWVDRMNAERTPGARTASFLVRPSEVGTGYDLVHDSAPKPCIHTTGPLNAERLAAIADLARRGTAWPIGLHPVSVRHDDRTRTLEVVFTALATFK